MEPLEFDELGDYIKQMRQDAGLERADLADRADRSVGYLNRLESGEYSSPGAQALQDIALAFGFESLCDFLTRCGEIRDRRAKMEEMIHADDDRAPQSKGRSG